MPAGLACDLFAALRTVTILIEPQLQELIVSVEGLFHLKSHSLFKVSLPFWIVRIGCGYDFDVTFDRHVHRLEQSDRSRFSTTIQNCSLQDITSISHPGEVLLITPGEILAGVATPHPATEFTEDVIVYFMVGRLACRTAVEDRPTSNH